MVKKKLNLSISKPLNDTQMPVALISNYFCNLIANKLTKLEHFRFKLFYTQIAIVKILLMYNATHIFSVYK